MNLATINRRVDSLHMAPATPSEGTSVHRSIPSLALTKGELAALYETAVNQGNTVRLDPGNGNILHAAVHELEADNEKAPTIVQQDTDSPGYYYYYYPLKSFMDEISSGTQEVSTFVSIVKKRIILIFWKQKTNSKYILFGLTVSLKKS